MATAAKAAKAESKARGDKTKAVKELLTKSPGLTAKEGVAKMVKKGFTCSEAGWNAMKHTLKKQGQLPSGSVEEGTPRTPTLLDNPGCAVVRPEADGFVVGPIDEPSDEELRARIRELEQENIRLTVLSRGLLQTLSGIL